MHVDLEPRTLAGTDLTVGRLILGTLMFGWQIDAPEATRIVERSRELGVTMVDTANAYAGGRSEEIVGAAVKPFRDEVQIATKVGDKGDVAPEHRGLGRSAILGSVDASLARLGTDVIDLLYLHKPDRDVPIEESLEALDEVVRAGKVRHVAHSNYAAWQAADMLCLCERHGWVQPRVSQQLYHLLARRLEDEYVECSLHHGLSDVVYNPLAGGLLTGKYRFDAPPPDDTRYGIRREWGLRYWHDTNIAAVDELTRIAEDAGMSLLELSLRWLLSRPVVDHVVVGVSSVAQLEANVAAVDGPAPDEATDARIDEVWETLRGVALAYNR